MLEITEAKAAEVLLDGDSVKPQLAHLRPKRLWEFILLVDLSRDRRDLVAGEALRRFANGVGHFAEVEIESGFGHVIPPAARASRKARSCERVRLSRARAWTLPPARPQWQA